MNWIDLIIIAVLAYYAIRGYDQGIISIIIELAGYIISYFVALRYANFGVDIISRYVPSSFPKSYEDTIGIAVIWTISIFIYYLLAPFIIRFIPPFISHSIINRIIGVLGSAIKGLLIVSIILFILSLLPLPNNIKEILDHSPLAVTIINTTRAFESKFGGNISSTLTNTIEEISLIPNTISNNASTEKLINLGYRVNNTTIDGQDEEAMFTFVNKQRVDRGLKALTLNNTLVNVAQLYGQYMFANGFFSHITPSGQSPFDRVKDANLQFIYVGENIAKAPSVDAADTGFMNSPEHKANILDPHYNQVGIGVVDGGDHGKMYVQDFIGTE